MPRRSSDYELQSFTEDGEDEPPRTKVPPSPQAPPRKPLRRSFWLTKTALIAIALVFIACASILAWLSRYISRQNGLPLTITSSHYAWTYGPTAILVLILTGWRQVDYQYKSRQPWWELFSGPSPASRSVLLDYLSPFQPLSCIEAFRNGHYVVALSILTYFILKIVILISTTLFVVQPTLHEEPVTIRYHNSFNTDNMWKSLAYENSSPNEGFFSPTTQADVSIWSYMAEVDNVTAADGSGLGGINLAYQSFSLPDLSLNISSASAPVDVFIPKVTCEQASLSHSIINGSVYYQLNSSTCAATDLYMLSASCGTKPTCVSTLQFYHVNLIDCSAGNDEGKMASEMTGTRDRLAVVFANMSLEHNATRYQSIHTEEAAAIFCKIDYGMVSVTASQSYPNRQTTFEDDLVLEDTPRHLPNLTDKDLAYILSGSLSAAFKTLVVTHDIPDDDGFPAPTYAFFQLMATRLNWAKDRNLLLQPSVLLKMSAEIFTGISNSFARTALLFEDSQQKPSEATAQAQVSENKLHMRYYSLWPMVAGFILLSALCLVLLFIVPENNANLNISGSIASHATVIASSPSMLGVLKDAGQYRSSQLKKKLEGMKFKATVSNEGLSVQALGSGGYVPSSTAKKRPWLPLSGRLYMVVLLFTLPVLSIGILELLQRLSDRRHGFFNLANADSAEWSYVVRLASTLVAFTTATMFNNLDSTIAIFTPYSILRSGSVPADRSIMYHLLEVSPLLVPFDTMRSRQIGPAASSLAALIGSFLTIAVSGLWIAGDPVQRQWNSTATTHNWENSWLYDSLDDQGAAIALNIIRHRGANTPSYIHDYAVLPMMSLDSFSASARKVNSTFEMTALRPVLKCDALPKENIVATSVLRMESGGRMGSYVQFQDALITLKMNVPPGCSSNATDNGLISTDLQIQRGRDASDEPDSRWIGHYWDLKANSGTFEGACPTAGILFGSVGKVGGGGAYGDFNTGNLTALFCTQGIEEVPATITYKGDPKDNHLDDVNLHVEKARAWRNETSNGTSLNFKLEGLLSSGLTPMLVLSSNPDNSGYYDIFFNHLIFGPENLALADLVGPENIKNLTDAVSRNYREYMSHILDHNFRSEAAGVPVEGMAWQMTARISIHRTSKVILQALLAAMTVLGLVGYKLVRLRGTLPRNPCGVASTMGFLADSQLCAPGSGILPENAGIASEKELRRGLQGYVFSLGWWDEVDDKTKSTGTSLHGGEPRDPGVVDRPEAGVTRRRYFGIDVGRADTLGYSSRVE